MGLIVEYNNGSFIHTPHAHTSGDRRTHQRSNGRGGPPCPSGDRILAVGFLYWNSQWNQRVMDFWGRCKETRLNRINGLGGKPSELFTGLMVSGLLVAGNGATVRVGTEDALYSSGRPMTACRDHPGCCLTISEAFMKRTKGSVCKVVFGQSEVEFRFSTGKSLVVSPGEFTADILNKATLLGLSNTIRDCFAGVRNLTLPGESVGDAAYRLARARIDTLQAGVWKSESEIRFLLEAIMEATGEPADRVQAKLATLEKGEKKALSEKPRVAKIIARLELEAMQSRLERMEEEDESDDDLMEF